MVKYSIVLYLCSIRYGRYGGVSSLRPGHTATEKRETRNEKRETRNEKRETRNEKRETRNEERGTRNEERDTRNEKSDGAVTLPPRNEKWHRRSVVR